MRRTRALLVILFATLLLGGCVTETTGGFNVKKSDEDALRDYLRLAAGYLQQGDTANAKRHLNNAGKIDPNNSEMHAIWGLLYARERDLKLADRSFQKALSGNPSNSKARNNYAAFLYANGRFEDAYKQLEKVVEDAGYDARSQAFENLGLAALRINRQTEAEGAFLRALQLNPNQLVSTLELCSINLARNDVKQAQTFYRGFLTMTQLYNIQQNARSLWIGVQLEAALGNRENARNYGRQLETNFASAPETRLYKQLADNFK